MTTMQTGISAACFYPMHTEQSLRLLGEQGVPSTEIFINAARELEPAYLRELRSIADGFGIQILSLHPYISMMEPLYFFSQYDRRFQEGLDTYKRFFQAANILGADIVVFHGNSRFSSMGCAEYAERFLRLWEDAAAQGVDLCQENVERCSANNPAFFRELRALLPKTGFVLDVKQAVRARQDVFEMAAAMADGIRHIHLSDHDAGHSCLVPGSGVFNMRKLLAVVGENGFSGGVIVELYRENFGEIVELIAGYQRVSHMVSTYIQTT